MEHQQTTMSIPTNPNGKTNQDYYLKDDFLDQLNVPKDPPFYFYQGFWNTSEIHQSTINFQKHFKAEDTDIILASNPKCGTTWLKSLVYCILNRINLTSPTFDLLQNNPHTLVPNFEYNVYPLKNTRADLTSVVNNNTPRLLSTHLPYNVFPSSIKESKCRIVYIARNPFDTFISTWKFFPKLNPGKQDDLSIEEHFEKFCDGFSFFGPYWDHVLQYWEQSLQRSDNVLFIKYEDMKKNGISELKKIAKFLGSEFSLEEENNGVLEEIIKMCSLGNLKELEINKTGSLLPSFENKMFFRKGEVGDWANYLTEPMVDKMHQLMTEKFHPPGLHFDVV